MTLKEIETAIVDKLKADITTGIRIEAWPDNPEDYQVKNAPGALLVIYAGESYEPPPPGFGVVQKRILNFECAIFHRHLKKNDGAYSLIDSVKSSLTGYRIGNLTQIYMIAVNFVSYENAVWQYNVRIGLDGTHLQV